MDRYLSYVKVGIRNPIETLDSNGKDWDLQARSIDRVFDSKEKADKYILEHNDENFVNISGIDWNVEEWEVEWMDLRKCKSLSL